MDAVTGNEDETLISKAEAAYKGEKLKDALERILSWHKANNPATASELLPGLSESQVDDMVKPLPFKLPKEARDLYLWRNGTRADSGRPFIWYHEFLSLELAVHEYQKLVADRRISHWHESWFPLFSFQGEYYFVHCSARQRSALPVRHYFIQQPETSAGYTNVTTMMVTAAECMETGVVYLANEHGAFGDDIRKVSDIHRKNNPGRPFPYHIPKKNEE